MIARGITTALPPSEAAFAQGVLFGERSQLPADIQTATQETGLTHILAVSGYNLTIVVALVLVFWKKRTWPGILAALIAIGFFVVMTGSSASVVRAGVMSALILLIGRTRRQLDARIALAATVLVMTAWNPRYLYVDVGWQLSVMALVGVLFLAPALMPRRELRLRWLVELFVVSLAAHLATAPIIMYVFGSFSIIAPLANLLVLPLIPLVMFGGFVAATFGLFWPAHALMLAQPIVRGINAVLELIVWLARLPSANVPVRIDVVGLVVGYGLLGIIIVLGMRKHSHLQVKKV